MKLVVTTSFSVLAVDCLTGRSFYLHRGAGLYFGIARLHGELIIGGRRRMMDSFVPRLDERGCLISLSLDGTTTAVEPPFPLRDIHSIAVDNDRLFVTCSLDEKIVIRKGDDWEEWYPFGRPLRDGTDTHHINTVALRPDGIYVVCHNFGQSEVVRFDHLTLRPTWRALLGVGAHDIWFDDGNLRICSSSEGKLVGLDGLCVAVGGYPRGYSSTASHRVVGISQEAPRSERDHTNSSLLLMDRAYRPIHNIELHGEGMILASLVVDDAEFAQLETNYGGKQTIASRAITRALPAIAPSVYAEAFEGHVRQSPMTSGIRRDRSARQAHRDRGPEM